MSLKHPTLGSFFKAYDIHFIIGKKMEDYMIHRHEEAIAWGLGRVAFEYARHIIYQNLQV